MTDLNAVELLFGHTDEDTAILVDDYPYGRRIRTQIRYWLESRAKHGDRFVSQTLNPKTGRWNKPKKSTYTTIGVIYRNPENGHIKWTGLGTWPDEAAIAKFCGTVGVERLNEVQKGNLAELIARTRVFKHVKWEVKEQGTYNLSEPGELERMKADDEAREPERQEQDRIMRNIWAAVGAEAQRSRKALG